jgi:hypothetical protein
VVENIELSENRSVGYCPECGARVYFGPSGRIRELHVEGQDHTEVANVIQRVGGSEPHAALLSQIAVGSFIVGAFLAALGVILVYLGSTGDTEFNLFGQTFKSQSVGVAAIFIGAVLIVLNIRRMLNAIKKKGS